MTIPEIRQRLYELSVLNTGTDLGVELGMLADELWRRQSPRSLTADQRIESTHVTPLLAYRIREYARDHPDETMLSIGRHFNVNQGRVSEALYGKRE